MALVPHRHGVHDRPQHHAVAGGAEHRDSPPASIIEPAIALSIVFVGADNLVRGDGRDLRAWVALVFGLVHGFGFANVLREFGLPREALGWSLFSFNLGVEIGQLAIVLVVASAAGGRSAGAATCWATRGVSPDRWS